MESHQWTNRHNSVSQMTRISLSCKKIKEQLSWFPATLTFRQLPPIHLVPCHFSITRRPTCRLTWLRHSLSLSFCHLYNPPLMVVAGSFFCSRYFSLEKIRSMEECLEQRWLLLSALAVCQDLATCLEEVLLTNEFRPLCHLSASLLQNSNTHKHWIISAFIQCDLHESQRHSTQKTTMAKTQTFLNLQFIFFQMTAFQHSFKLSIVLCQDTWWLCKDKSKCKQTYPPF